MARSGKRARRLVVGEQTFLWSVRHRHQGEAGRYEDCREMLGISRQGARGRLLIVFRAGPGRLVPDGTGPSGIVGTAPENTLPNGPGLRPWLNLHEPGAVRALLDEATTRGWDPDDPATTELDGWLLFNGAIARGRPN